MFRKDLQVATEKMSFENFIFFDGFGSAGLKTWKDLHRLSKIFYQVVYKFYFRLLTTDDFLTSIKRRIEEERSREYDESMRMLIPQPEEMLWGEKRIGNWINQGFSE